MSDIKRMASELAPELDKLLSDYLNNGMVMGSKKFYALEQFLWDNKVGILRILEHAAQQS